MKQPQQHQPYHLHQWEWSRNRSRGARIASFSRYRDLVADAQARAVAAGYPKSRWMDLFDWAKD